MEPFIVSFFYYGLCILPPLIIHVIFRRKASPRMPPGPWQLPLIGSLHHLLGGLPHRTMRDLSLRHGPLMHLKICERVAFVVSSAEVAREIFKGHDTAFEQRPSSPSIDEMYSAHGMGIIFAPYGEHWRLLRRILVTELLSAHRVAAFGRIRQDEASRLVSSLIASSSSSSSPPAPVDVSELLAEFVADSSVRAIFGDRLPDRAAFLRMRKKATEFSSLFELRDLFPSSRLTRHPRSPKAEQHRREVSRLIGDILRLREERRAAAGDLQEVFGAALDTSTTTLQWAMAELIANPRVREKAQLEIRRVLAGQERVHDEALRELRYLKAVIKETLRIHPPTALLTRLCMQHGQKIQGYDVPRGTMIVTNVWAISRDPKYWKDPDSFMPERFEGEGASDFGGSYFNFTPFGAGRRICPGIDFAEANILIALASLLYHFDWELPSGVKEEGIDMTESFGVTTKWKAQLLLHPIPRIPIAFGSGCVES
ncbi:unnamed protein product [Urochloa humidicola]